MSKFNIQVDIEAPERKKHKRDKTWPQVIEEDDLFIEPLELFLFIGHTKEDPENEGEYIDISEWFTDNTPEMELLWSHTGENHDLTGYFIHTPKNWTFNMYGNASSLVPESIIEAEYGSGNEDRWKRKPLGHYNQVHHGKPGNRWITNYENDGFWNIYIELKKSSDSEPFAKINPDLEESGDNVKLKPKAPSGVETEPAQYKGGMIYGKFYMAIRETGTKTFAHYLAGSHEQDRLDYTFEWLEPEGIYFCPFDLSDKDNFKITREPSYTADGTSAKFMSGGAWEIYLMPRRWFYYVRYTESWTTQDTIITSSGWECTALCDQFGGPITWPEADIWDWEDDGVGTLNLVCGEMDFGAYFKLTSYSNVNCGRLFTMTFGYSDSSLETLWTDYDWQIEQTCTGCHCGYNFGAPVNPFICWDCEGNVISESPSSPGTHPCVRDCTGPMVGSSSGLLETRVAESRHTIGFFWGPWPSNFQIVGAFPDKIGTKFWSPPSPNIYDDPYATVEFVTVPTVDQAEEYMEDAGGTQEQIDGILSGGSNMSIHCFRSGTNFFAAGNIYYYVGNYPSGDWQYSRSPSFSIDVMRSSASLQPRGEYMLPDLEYENHGAKRLWEVIENSNFWSDVISPLRDADKDDAIGAGNDEAWLNRMDSIPYGVGISPSVEGSLVAIIRKKNTSKVYYVWRRTDEEFEEMRVGDEADVGYLSFESSSYLGDGNVFNYELEGEQYGVSSIRSFNGTVYSGLQFEVEWLDQFYSEAPGRKLTRFGREPDFNLIDTDCDHWHTAFTAVDNTTGSEDLHAPVYVMMSKDRATFLSRGNASQDDYINQPAWNTEAIRYSQYVSGRNYMLSYSDPAMETAVRNRY